MPVYCYKCKDCHESFEVRHSMTYEDQACIVCNSENIFVIPNLPDKLTKLEKKQVGSIVEEYIEEAKREIKEDKKSLLSREL